ncbi:MAG: TIGR02452 family protein [Clostridia bacterium]|nr:TIGR02452 family protein [Clostridia bacterium]
MNNIELFHDTQARIESDQRLRIATIDAIKATSVFPENTYAQQIPFFENPSITFEENLTLIPAEKLAESGKKAAVLNFANPVEPGGGVLRGASAQEEYLCRASNLYNCLISQNALAYYQKNRELLRINRFKDVFWGSDEVVYSPNITFFRKDEGYIPDMECTPCQVYTETWHTIDVLTCAAPYLYKKNNSVPMQNLESCMKQRIRNILEVAISNDIQALVLGAFGCGAFNNPPTVVANAFQSVFLEDRYRNAFSDVIFSIKRTGFFCENIEAFEIAFSQFPPTGNYVFSCERNKRRFFT